MDAITQITDYDPRKLAEDGAKLFLNDPRGKPTKAWIQLKGADSDTYQEAMREQLRRRSAAMNKARRLKMPDPEEIEGDALDLLIVSTIDWGSLELVGYKADIVCSVSAARELYQKRPDIKEQVDAFVTERSNFLTSAASG